MTDTAAREEAVERVRAYVEAMEPGHDDHSIDGVLSYDGEKLDQLLLGDLRLLLSGGEGGSVVPASPALPVITADEPAMPLNAALLAARQALEPFVAFINVAEDAATMNWGAQIEDSKVVGSVSGEMGGARLRAKDLRRAREAHATIQAALTDPRQPSEADAGDRERLVWALVRARECLTRLHFAKSEADFKASRDAAVSICDRALSGSKPREES